MRRILIALSALLLLSACDSTHSLVELRQAAPNADPYQAALAAEYADYAAEKQANFQWWTSKYFADKGLLAAYGKEVEPEDPAQWKLDPGTAAQFNDARSQLMEALPTAKAEQPKLAADTVVAYDRWIVLADNGWDAGRIDEARDGFFTLLGKLQQSHEEAQVTAPKPVETTSTVLYFPFDKADLSGSAKLALDQLVAYVKAAGNVGITINGHADRAGSDAYNMKLSEERAIFVQQALAAAGVPEKLMHYFAFGESDPEVPTADGVPEPLNRRVEIFLE